MGRSLELKEPKKTPKGLPKASLPWLRRFFTAENGVQSVPGQDGKCWVAPNKPTES